jgi:hypothetical protein
LNNFRHLTRGCVATTGGRGCREFRELTTASASVAQFFAKKIAVAISTVTAAAAAECSCQKGASRSLHSARSSPTPLSGPLQCNYEIKNNSLTLTECDRRQARVCSSSTCCSHLRRGQVCTVFAVCPRRLEAVHHDRSAAGNVSGALS